MSATSYEFLASFAAWEEACKQNPQKLDTLPVALSTTSNKWTYGGELLNLLAPYKEGKAGATKQHLASLAKDGESARSAAGGQSRVRGFPKIVTETAFAARTDAKGQETDAALWEQFSAPTPSLLDSLPAGCVLVRVDVVLTSPWYSRDDLPFYPMENVLRRNSVFGMPFLSASSLKGLLHWANRMSRKTTEDDAAARFLFGCADEDGESVQGALYCYPVNWSGQLGLEVINPQNMETGAGTNPIKYEVLKPEGKGTLFFLLTNLPNGRALTSKHVQSFLESLDFLCTNGSLSAKSTVGWGRFKVTAANFAIGGMGEEQAQFVGHNLLQEAQHKDEEEAWQAITDSAGALLPLEGNDNVFTNRRIKALLPDFSNKMLKDRAACYAKIQERFAARSAAAAESKRDTGTHWLLGEKGAQDFQTFTSHLLKAFGAKEGRA